MKKEVQDEVLKQELVQNVELMYQSMFRPYEKDKETFEEYRSRMALKSRYKAYLKEQEKIKDELLQSDTESEGDR